MRKPPQFLFIDVNRRCNFRCQHCEYWKNDDSDKEHYLSIDRRNEIIDEFAEISLGRGTVVICGGESMLDREEYFAVAKQCLQHDCNCFSVVNGSNIKSGKMAERMILEGPSAITVSLNSHVGEVHERTRGIPGSFNMAVTALRLLVAARDRLGSPKKIYAMAVVCEQNYRSLEPFYDFVLNDIKADKLKLNFLQPTFGAQDPKFIDNFFSENIIKNYGELAAILAQCNTKYGLNLNPAWVEAVMMYHRSVERNGDALMGWQGRTGTAQHMCNSYERNIMVNLYGRARLCFSTAFPAYKLTKRGDLKHFWENSDFIREKMRSCNAYCGISHSVRKENATLKSAKHVLQDGVVEIVPIVHPKIDQKDKSAQIAEDRKRLAAEIEQVLWKKVLPAWFPRCLDYDNGGFHENYTCNWKIIPRNAKFLVYQARMTWTAAAAALVCKEEAARARYRDYAIHGLNFLAERMWHAGKGGFLEYTYDSGHPIWGVMPWVQLYSYAFGLFAAATVYRATGSQKALALSVAAFDWLDRRAHDDLHGGYFEHIRQDGSPVALDVPQKPLGQGLMVIGKVGFKSMNAHLHQLEALIGLRNIIDDPLVNARLQEVFEIMRDRIIMPGGHLNMFCQRDFTTSEARGSYGHQLEMAYILHEASSLLNEKNDERTCSQIHATVENALQWGRDGKFGGFYEEGPPHAVATQKNKIWWVQLEAMSGLLTAFRLFPHEKKYFQHFTETWNFFRKYMLDSDHGDCFDTVTPNGTTPLRINKATKWKAAYHITKGLLFAIDELRKQP